MNNRTAIIIATVGVVLSLCLGIVGGAAAGFMAYRYAPRAAGRFAQVPSQVLPGIPNQINPGQQQARPRFRNFGTQGALITSVAANSPAAAAGLQQGDVITAVGGQTVDGSHPLNELIAQNKPGNSIELHVSRNGQTQTLNITLGTNTSNASQPYLGVTFMMLTASPSATPGSGN